MFGTAGFAGSLLAGRVGDVRLRAALVACFLLEGLGVAPDRSVAVEDSGAGIRAAAAANGIAAGDVVSWKNNR